MRVRSEEGGIEDVLFRVLWPCVRRKSRKLHLVLASPARVLSAAGRERWVIPMLVDNVLPGSDRKKTHAEHVDALAKGGR